MLLPIYIDETTLARLQQASRETGRSVVDLAERAVEEAALEYAKSKGDYRGSNS